MAQQQGGRRGQMGGKGAVALMAGSGVLGVMGLAVCGTAGWLMHRAMMNSWETATIDRVDPMGKEVRLALHFSPPGKGTVVNAELVVPDRPACPYAVGQALPVRYDWFKPEDVRMDVNVGLLVGSTALLIVGVAMLGAAGFLFVKGRRRRRAQQQLLLAGGGDRPGSPVSSNASSYDGAN